MRVNVVLVIGREGPLLDEREHQDMPALCRRVATLYDQGCVIVGSKHWRQAHPFEARDTLVLTRDHLIRERIASMPYTHRVRTLEHALARAEELGYSECWVIGGTDTLTRAIPLARSLYIARIVCGEEHGRSFNTGKGWITGAAKQRYDDPDSRKGLSYTWERWDRVS